MVVVWIDDLVDLWVCDYTSLIDMVLRKLREFVEGLYFVESDKVIWWVFVVGYYFCLYLMVFWWFDDFVDLVVDVECDDVLVFVVELFVL